jgi:3-deoxy-D-manno-octulosonic-acid transferase
MLTLYKFFSYLVYVWFYLVGRTRAASGDRLYQGRLGLIERHGPTHLWIHAASVGEIRVISYLVDYLLTQQPQVKIHVTTMTSAGFRTASDLLGDSVTLTYFPLDAPPAVSRTLDQIEPRVLVIAETEIWPNLITEAARRKIPLVQINGRMSDGAFNRYRHIRSMLSDLINKYDHWFLKTDQDADRYHRLGLKVDAGEVAGDMKFDAPLRQLSDDQKREVRSRAGASAGDFVFVAGSTRPGEEAMLIELFRTLSAHDGSFILIVAPRHIDRVSEITAELDKMELRWRLYDTKAADDSGSDSQTDAGDGLVIVDTVGQLNDIYIAANLAFVGGTLVDIGGHNLLEPVWGQTPVLFGPYIDNVREAGAYIVENNYGRQVNSLEQLTATVEQVYKGQLSFAVKAETDLTASTTARIGTYLLEMLGDA